MGVSSGGTGGTGGVKLGAKVGWLERPTARWGGGAKALEGFYQSGKISSIFFILFLLIKY